MWLTNFDLWLSDAVVRPIVLLVALLCWFLLRCRVIKSYVNPWLVQIINLVDLLIAVLGVFALSALVRPMVTPAAAEKMATVADFVATLVFTWFLTRAVELFWLARNSKRVHGLAVLGIFRVLIYAAALLMGAFVFAWSHDLSLSGIYLSTGAIAAIVAFTAQKTLGDLFAGLALSVEHPFSVGDYIVLENGIEGHVTDLNWRATKLRDWNNSSITYPNSELARQVIRNYHSDGHRYSPWYEVKLPPTVDPRFAKALVLEAAIRCEHVIKTPSPSVRLKDSGTVPYTYMVWLHFRSYVDMFAGREEFYREMHDVLKNAGFQAAPDVQEVHMRRSEAVNVEPPSVQSALSNLDFTTSLSEEEITDMVQNCQVETYDAGSLVIADKEVAKQVYVILNGVIATSVSDANGQSRSIDQLTPGDYFGLASMLTGEPSFQNFNALTETSLIGIDLESMKKITAQRPELAELFAEIVDKRIKKADAIRALCKRSFRTPSMREIMSKIDTMLVHRPKH